MLWLTLIILGLAITTPYFAYFFGASTTFLASIIQQSKPKNELADILITLLIMIPMAIVRLLMLLWIWGFALSFCYAANRHFVDADWIRISFYVMTILLFMYGLSAIERKKYSHNQSNSNPSPLSKNSLVLSFTQVSRERDQRQENTLEIQINVVFLLICACLLLTIPVLQYPFEWVWQNYLGW